uniref:Gamma carbonic anhydrase n=1 Tax=Attheya septentrionalis TaxID=420275 RepID=A0A7S2UMN8_9STRA|mmetsp:Transcript_4983/g.8758  ORF Transcript_4983/g.8758 Transcript_4983/m.8758 type:complete len:240 (+) Transcript_4983:49-768(+)|eukprot:CAMPEP_0198281390 /NCGR_PEP_ID=MMETSP1449-20131203/1349_1 /TAXON_ID=420275 /ORGANISM="Attheya septentrionalis, Strain CCMP2084" /LENGTH=239 /DNA_ID=CAMNT_0043977155 /DNA_START=32 /DNA_END=751 /DNA_ORIENTATION=-
MAGNGALKEVMGRALRETGAALKNAGGVEVFTRHRAVMPFRGVKPFTTNDTFIAPNASVIGDVINWDESSVWYGAVVRADSSHPITIGFASNVQDRAVVSTLGKQVETLPETGFPPICHIGHYVSVGAGSVLISCRVEDMVDIGEKCTILEGALVESNVVLEPGTVVPAYARIPAGQKWGGNPAQFIQELDDEAKDKIVSKAEAIAEQAQEHIVEFLPIGNTFVQLEDLEQQAAGAKQG